MKEGREAWVPRQWWEGRDESNTHLLSPNALITREVAPREGGRGRKSQVVMEGEEEGNRD